MKRLEMRLGALALGLVLSGGAQAASLSRDAYRTGKDEVAAEYKVAVAACAWLSGSQKGLCGVEARGRERVARAELDAAYRPGARSLYRSRLVRADADYDVARERCKDEPANGRDACFKKAKTAVIGARAEAAVQMKIAASEKLVAARQGGAAATPAAQSGAAQVRQSE